MTSLHTRQRRRQRDRHKFLPVVSLSCYCQTKSLVASVWREITQFPPVSVFGVLSEGVENPPNRNSTLHFTSTEQTHPPPLDNVQASHSKRRRMLPSLLALPFFSLPSLSSSLYLHFILSLSLPSVLFSLSLSIIYTIFIVQL